ncbi:splicing factor 3B subunit 2 [Cryptosporidium felis]|nr:splicing factor 3B subunit 2 [Cryptosporidium felis]
MLGKEVEGESSLSGDLGAETKQGGNKSKAAIEHEYKKVQRKLKKQKRKENKKRRKEADEVKKGRAEDGAQETESEEEVVFEFQENEDLKRMFGEACKYLVGLDHLQTGGSQEVGKEADKTRGREDQEEEGGDLDGQEEHGVNMRLEMEEEEEREEEEREERRRKAREMRSRNNGVLGKLSIKELKERAEHPELVEIWDTTADDPEFLVYLKGCQGSVRVPQHWNSKRRYLQGKKGLERPPYKLPHFIEETKVAEIRALLLEEESRMSLKQKQRRKIRPKLNRMDIDYQVLHDAFFVHSTKPSLTQFGDLYYEGKEFEFKYKSIRPGKLSQRLKEALGMQPNWPPPWLVRMQKYGPPPSYPYLRVPGVNSQIPNGCEFGFRPGEWGKPPLDDEGKPIWGLLPPLDEDEPITLGSSKLKMAKSHLHSQVDYWGEIELDLFDETENQDQEQQNCGEDRQGLPSDSKDVIGHGPSAPKIVANNPFLFTTGSQIGKFDAEDKPLSNDQEQGQSSAKPLYTVIEQKEIKIDGSSIFPSSHGYSFK